MDTVLALTSAFRDSAPNNPSLGYTPNNVLPSNAQQVTAPDGTVFNAPPNADFVRYIHTEHLSRPSLRP